MMKNEMLEKLDQLAASLEGELYYDDVHRVLYATDASSYREKPLAVTIPKSKSDIQKIIRFAAENRTSVIPRAAGTSLAGQVVGPGVVMDITKYFNRILELNVQEKWAWVEPGVNLAELNQSLKQYGLQFGPETSTANRCRLGGMLGNNSCGLHSLVYGSVRDHILEVDTILSDGSEVTFKALDKIEFGEKCKGDEALLETKIYRQIRDRLNDESLRKNIEEVYPEKKVTRRNMGYAVDSLMNSEVFPGGKGRFNFAKLLAGSEGTLAFTRAMKINLVPLPPPVKAVIAAHFHTLEASLEANIVVLKHSPSAIELMDDIIIECTRDNIEQRKNRFWLEGNPGAVLVIELTGNTQEELELRAEKIIADLKQQKLGYHFPLVFGNDKIQRVWNLRTAGLGLLSNIPGDKRSVTVIEDTAVAPERLPAYVKDFKKVLEKYGLECVFYAHIATGELHLRPLLNLKEKADKEIYASIAQDVAALVKKHRGSLSGEHGDGRLRGAQIPFMFGEDIYKLFKEIKATWDPKGIFNPGKIVDVPPITEGLRYHDKANYPNLNTYFDFSSGGGFLQSVEKCNGSGDCRKSELIGGTMCPTFMATRDEDKSTRARANMLREMMHQSGGKALLNKDVYEVLDLCLSCKACKSECPSNVDMAKFKAEFLQHYYDEHGIPWRSLMVAYLPVIGNKMKYLGAASDWLLNLSVSKKISGMSRERKIPGFRNVSLKKQTRGPVKSAIGKVYFFADEFTRLQEPEIGIKAIALLQFLGYEVLIPKHGISGRTFLSKGLLKKARAEAMNNVHLLSDLVTAETPLIGLEPSTILTFRDEYPDLLKGELKDKALTLSKNALLFEEFFMREVEAGRITKDKFKKANAHILFHGHCQQKSIASTQQTREMLSFPENYSAEEIKSGCCGMAGSFGYEKEHFALSMEIGEMVLFPAVRNAKSDKMIAASGTSCRHHIADGTGKKAVHPVEIMYEALNI